MKNFNYEVICPCCSATLLRIANANVAAWKNFLAENASKMTCDCGSACQLVDDGNPSGGLSTIDVSAPDITSINISSGPRTGGTAVFLQGEALNVGTLVVRFGGVPVLVCDQITETTARVVTPPASYRLNYSEVCVGLQLTPILGEIAEGETLVASTSETCTVRRVDSGRYYVGFSTPLTDPQSLIGKTVVGNGGGIATITNVIVSRLLMGETVCGLTSAALATVSSLVPLTVTGPTAGFAAYELVRGATSGAIVRLTDVPYSGQVDVTVENEYGSRPSGSCLPGAFTYT